MSSPAVMYLLFEMLTFYLIFAVRFEIWEEQDERRISITIITFLS